MVVSARWKPAGLFRRIEPLDVISALQVAACASLLSHSVLSVSSFQDARVCRGSRLFLSNCLRLQALGVQVRRDNELLATINNLIGCCG